MKHPVSAIVLAAGESKRFHSATPKVLHSIAGRPVLGHVLEALRGVRPGVVSVVVSPGGRIEKGLDVSGHPFDVKFAVQKSPRGTADAARAGLAAVPRDAAVLVVAGDAPAVRPETLKTLLRAVSGRRPAAAALLTAVLDEPADYGRVLMDGTNVRAVVEARDASPEELAVREINASMYAFGPGVLPDVLPLIDDANAAGELYLTDAVRILVDKGEAVKAVRGEPGEVLGCNTRRDFADVAAVLRKRALDAVMDAGVTVIDPSTTYVDAGVTVGRDSVLHPHTFLEGTTRIGAECEIGPSTRLVDTRVGDRCRISFCVAVEARIATGCTVGPFASLRAGTVLRAGAKAGTFVEMKSADIGEGSKVPHLSYMGDIKVGRGSNVGAGTITCNYDGSDKHRTEIGDDVFVGSDTMLVAPVKLAKGSSTGAGAVVTRDVGPGELVVGAPARPRKPSASSGKTKRKGGTKRKGS